MVLGVVRRRLRVLGSSRPHSAKLVGPLRLDCHRRRRHNYDNVLLPSGYALGIDNAAFAAAIATRTEQIRLLLAIRMGEFVAPQVVRQVATLQQIAAGRLTMQLAPRSGLDPSTRRVPVLPVKQSYVKTPTKRGMPRGTCGRESVGPVPGPERQLWATLIRCATRYLSWPRPE